MKLRQGLVPYNALAAILFATISASANAYQIAPMGSSFEKNMTRETPSAITRAADRLGRALKSPVHEEVTQLAAGCVIETDDIASDKSCAHSDRPFANSYVIYGLRWNDLPPFRLLPGEGSSCKKFITGAPACTIEQTIRLSTQPECWYCIFTDGEKTAKSGTKISGCPKEKHGKKGNMLTRSHFGDLQFIHSMANEDGIDAEAVRAKIIDWLQFAWQVSSKEIVPNTQLHLVDIPTIKEHFHCSGMDVADLYIQGRQDKLLPHIRKIAFGSVLHTVQDSFAGAHTEREGTPLGQQCSAELPLRKPGSILEFHSYTNQDGTSHDEKDERESMLANEIDGEPAAVVVSRQLLAYFEDGAKWQEVRPYIECVFTLAPGARKSSAGQFSGSTPGK